VAAINAVIVECTGVAWANASPLVKILERERREVPDAIFCID